jgi:multidrug resistance efflux pump
MIDLTDTTLESRRSATAVAGAETAPSAAPPAAHARPVPARGGGFAKWRARFIVTAMAAGAVFGGIKIAEARSAEAALLGIGPVTLTAEAVPVESLSSGQVTKVLVHAQDRVRKGQVVGTIVTTTANYASKIVRTPVQVKSPSNGIVTQEPLPVGSTLSSGQSLVELYDPADLTFVASVPLADLPKVSSGMTATLTARGLSTPVHAMVDRVVPRVGEGQSDVAPDYAQLVLVPDNPTEVAQLLPGLRFSGSIDTKSGSYRDGGGIYLD